MLSYLISREGSIFTFVVGITGISIDGFCSSPLHHFYEKDPGPFCFLLLNGNKIFAYLWGLVFFDRLYSLIKAGLTTAHVLGTTFVIGTPFLSWRILLVLFLPLPSAKTYAVVVPQKLNYDWSRVSRRINSQAKSVSWEWIWCVSCWHTRSEDNAPIFRLLRLVQVRLY